ISMPSSVALPNPLEELVTVRSSGGTVIPVIIQRANVPYLHSVILSGFVLPGWYTISVAMNPSDVENNDRSMIRDSLGYYGEVLIGASNPGVAAIHFMGNGPDASTAMIEWSEPVQFEHDPTHAIQLLGGLGLPLSCSGATAWSAAPVLVTELNCTSSEQP